MKKLHYLIIAMLLGFCLNAQVFVTGGGVGGWDPNGRVFLTSTDGINYSSTADFEITGSVKIGEAPGWQTIWGYDSALGSGWPGGTLPSTCGDCGTDISPAANGWYSVTYNINTNEYLFTPGINPFGPYPTFAPATPLTFEEPQTTIYYKFEDFGNETNQGDPKGGLTKIANPHKEGINTSNTVFQMIKRGASWSGSKFFTTPAIDFSASSKIIKIKIWSPRVGTVLKLKFEGDGDDQLEVASTVANAWEELIFDFSAKTMGTTRNQIAFQFEDGNDGYDPNTPARSNVADYTWLIDDISIVIAPPTAASQTFCTSQSATVNNLVATGTTLKWYAAASGGSALASNEALVEGTYYVSQTVGGNESPRTSVAVTIISNTGVNVSACGTSYTWPLSGLTYTESGNYEYTFGSCSTTLNLTLTPITNNTTVVSAENPYTWSNNGQVYATSGIKTGTTTNCVTELLNLTITNPVVHVTGGGVGGWDPNGKVFLTSTDGINYSSTASFEVTGDMKIGEATGFQNIWGYDETLGSGWPGGTLPNNCGDCGKNISPAANGWYNVTYNRNTKVYLFSPGINPFGPYPTLAPATPLTFEEPQTTIYYKTEDFGNETNQGDPKGGITKIANPHKEGINTSNTVFQMIKRGWASWSGSKFFTTPAIDFSASSKIVKVKIWSPRVGTVLKLKFEGDGDDQLEVASTVANAWEELIFDFSSKTMGTTRNQIAFQFEDGLNNGFDPNTPAQSNVADYTWLIDDISIVIAPPTAASQTFCSSASATVNDLVATGIALKWYAAASGGSALASNEALVEGTYYVSQTVGGNESPRTSVAVTIISNTPVTESACGTSYTWPLNGVTYTASGTYSYTSGSCSTTLNLTLTPITYNTTVVSAENPYTWSNNGQVYATSGIKTGTTTNCVTELLNLTITNPVVHVTGGGVGGWDPNGKVFLTSTDGINYSSTASFEITGEVKIGEATGYQNIWGYDDTLGSGWPGGTLPNNCGDCGKNISPAANGWYNVTYNRNTKVYLFTEGINPYGPYPTLAPSTPMTFEEDSATIYYKTEDFGNETNQGDPKGGLSKIANPHKEGINTSNTVFQMIKRGASWSGSKFFTTPAIDFSVSTKIIKVKIWSPRVGTVLKLKFEGGGGDDQVEVASTVANAWEELIFDFSSKTMGTSRNQIVFQFEDGLDGYDPNTPARSNVADYTWLIDDISLTQIPTTFPAFCKGATIATAKGSTSLKFYTSTSVTAVAVTLATALVTKTYYVTELINGVESSKVSRSITVNPLPTEVLGAMTSNTVSATTTTGFVAATLAVGQYVGTTTEISYRIPEFIGSDLSYLWTVPTGVTIVSSSNNALTVHYNLVAPGAGNIGEIKVQAVNTNGCKGTAKLIKVSKVLPSAPGSIKMTNAAIPVAEGKTAAAITTFAPYMGTDKELTLTATASATATSYSWELPTGVTQVSGGNTNVITVKFAGVTSSNTFNYLSTASVSTNVLRIGVKSVNGVGNSSTSNTTLANSSADFYPNSTSNAKLLTLTATLPAAPASLKMTNAALPVAEGAVAVAVTDISKFIGTDTVLTLTAAVSKLASSYSWEIPSSVTVVAGATLVDEVWESTSNVITVKFKNVPAGTASLYLGVKAENGIGSSVKVNAATLVPSTSSTATLLKVTAAAPATPAIPTGISAICPSAETSVTYTIAAVPAKATKYLIEAPEGATVNLVGTGTGTFVEIDAVPNATFTVNYSSGFISTTASPRYINIFSENGFGSGAIARALKLTNATTDCPAAPSRIVPEAATATEVFKVVAYPNPATEGFRVKSSNGKSFGVQVYDMLGRSIEQRQMSSDAQIGSNYAKGIYNVIVNQGANVKTLRVIKQ